MPQYKMVVLSNPVPGREQECNEWYETVHIPDMLAMPGFVAAQRSTMACSIAESNPYQYLAIYTIETEDLDTVVGGLLKAAESGNLYVSEALDAANAYAVIYDEGGAVVHSNNL